MTDAKLLKILNPVLAVVMVSEMASVLCLKFAWQPWVSQWHEYNGFLFFLLMLLHLVLNRSWIKAQFKR